jgi:hypothetical protein
MHYRVLREEKTGNGTYDSTSQLVKHGHEREESFGGEKGFQEGAETPANRSLGDSPTLDRGAGEGHDSEPVTVCQNFKHYVGQGENGVGTAKVNVGEEGNEKQIRWDEGINSGQRVRLGPHHLLTKGELPIRAAGLGDTSHGDETEGTRLSVATT